MTVWLVAHVAYKAPSNKETLHINHYKNKDTLHIKDFKTRACRQRGQQQTLWHSTPGPCQVGPTAHGSTTGCEHTRTCLGVLVIGTGTRRLPRKGRTSYLRVGAAGPGCAALPAGRGRSVATRLLQTCFCVLGSETGLRVGVQPDLHLGGPRGRCLHGPAPAVLKRGWKGAGCWKRLD